MVDETGCVAFHQQDVFYDAESHRLFTLERTLHTSDMELRSFAETVLLTPSLDAKLTSVSADALTDRQPGDVLVVETPARSESLLFAPPRAAPAMPKPEGFHDKRLRGVAHHIMANHELQALEVMAATLLAHPEAPTDFRMGMAKIMLDEQRHTRMHAARAEKLGVPFGSLPVNCYIWSKAREFSSLLDYLAGLPLVFEGANLDHSLEFAAAFAEVGDLKSANILSQIHQDEIDHVRFGIEWLRRFKPEDQSDWEAFVSHLSWPLRASKAQGSVFQHDARVKAGLSDDFIQQLLDVRD